MWKRILIVTIVVASVIVGFAFLRFGKPGFVKVPTGALAGETVQVVGTEVLINGQPLPERRVTLEAKGENQGQHPWISRHFKHTGAKGARSRQRFDFNYSLSN